MKFHVLLFIIIFCSLPALAQTEAEVKALKTIDEAGRSFKEGLLLLNDERQELAGEKFDKAVEAFITSGIDVRSNARLHSCYNLALETIYRIQFPADQKPQFNLLKTTCGWTLNAQLIDDVTEKLTKKSAPNNENKNLTAAALPQANITEQSFEASPPDDLAKLELTAEEVVGSDVAAVSQLEYSNYSAARIVKAGSGDTVAKVAQRNGASPVEVAKFNGLLPDTIIAAGREIRIPARSNSSGNSPGGKRGDIPIPSTETIRGHKPVQQTDGKIAAVISYFNENLHDPYSMRFVRWSALEKATLDGKPYWTAQVKYRAKNTLGAYVLTEEIFYIQKNKVVKTRKL